MNKLLLLLGCFMFFFTAQSQTVPASIPYQAIARNSSGQALANTAITIQFRIYNTFVASGPVYQEAHTLNTDALGYFNVKIGTGTVQSGSFAAVIWSTGDVSYEIWLDTGSGLSQLGGRSNFLSVPYALYAGNAAPSPTISINTPNSISNPSTGNYSITVPAQTLTLNNTQLSISNGNSVTLPAGTTYTPGAGISITSGSVITNTSPNQTVSVSGPGVTGAYPSYSIAASPATTVAAGSNVTVSQSGNTYTVNAVPSLSLTGNQLSISNGNSVTLPVYIAGAGIAINSGTITNTAPNQVVNITGPNVTGAYPNYNILPVPPTTITSGTNITVSQSGNSYTVNAVTPVLTGNGNASVSGTYPNQTITVPPATIIGLGLATVTSAAPAYTVNVPTPSISFNNATGTYSYTQGAYSNTLNLSPNTTFSSGTLTVGSNTAAIPGTGIWSRTTGTVTLANTTDNVGIGVAAPVERLAVSGNIAIPAANQYKYATPKTRYYGIPGAELVTEGTYHRQTIVGDVYIVDGSPGVQGNLYAGVHLPDGAVITGLDAYVLDNDGTAGHDITYVQLWRQDGAIGSGFGNQVSVAATPGTSTTSSGIVKLSTTTITSGTVDNSNYVYFVRVGTVQATTNSLITSKIVITYTITGVE